MKPRQFGPFTTTPARPRQRREPLLQRAALRARLGEARGEDDGAADLAAPAGGDGLEHRLLRHVEDDGVEPRRQVVDGGARSGCPPISALVRLTRWSSPAKPARSRLASTLPPIERGSSDAPTMATERGFSEARDGGGAVRPLAPTLRYLTDGARGLTPLRRSDPTRRASWP